MKKATLVMLSVIAFAILSALPIKPSQAYIEGVAWTNPTYRGYDDYHNQWVVAYEEGATWTVSAMIYNNYNPPGPATEAQMNISTIIMWFEWGKNYTHRFTTPETLAPGETRIFTFSNMTPPTSEAPELWTYEYELIVEVVNATSGPLGFVFYWSWWNWDYDFAVYSSDHLETQQLRDKLETLFGMGPMWLPMNVTEAMVLYTQGYFEYQSGNQTHERGDFSAAKTYFENAEDLFNQALTVYEQKGTAIEDTNLSYKEALANATRDNAQANLVSANAALINSYAWMFFGIGWVLIGIGIIIYGARKPKTPQ
jgi:hypothetical protein